VQIARQDLSFTSSESTLQTGELSTPKGYLHTIVGAEFFGVNASLLR
jgi:hypothetical protein